MSEIWKDIEGFYGYYQVSDIGRIKSLDRVVQGVNNCKKPVKSRILKHALNTNGYPSVALMKLGKQKMSTVHRLVAKAFITNPENKPHINHIDHNPLNTHALNLEWVTVRENCSHSKLGAGTSSFVGVSFCTATKKWISMIDFGGKSKRLGLFDKEEDAAKAYINALKSKNIKNKYAII